MVNFNDWRGTFCWGSFFWVRFCLYVNFVCLFLNQTVNFADFLKLGQSEHMQLNCLDIFGIFSRELPITELNEFDLIFRNTVVVRKTFHRYTVRAKRGTAQGMRDSKQGGHQLKYEIKFHDLTVCI